jgi:hypothetical protein
VFHAVELATGEPSVGWLASRQPSMHQCDKIPPESALVRVTVEHLLGMLGVDSDLLSLGMIALAPERTVDARFLSTSADVQADTAFGRRLFEGRFCLQPIDVNILSHEVH